MNKLIPVLTVIALLTVTLFVMNDTDDSDAVTDGDWVFTVNSSDITKATLTKYLGTNTSHLVIPATVTDGTKTYTVVNIKGTNSSTPAVPNSSLLPGCTIELPESLVQIGEYAFYNCSNLTGTLNIYASLIQARSFIGCSGLTSINFLGATTNLSGNCFQGCTGLTSIDLTHCNISNATACFRGCTGLTSVTFDDSTTKLPEYLFEDCTGLTSIQLPKALDSIENYAFSGCTNLRTVDMPNSLTRLGPGAFRYCSSLEGIVIPDGITTIFNGTFQDCTSLEYVVLPDSLTTFQTGTATGVAFAGCTSLATVYNASSLNITAQDTANGYVGYYANTIYICHTVSVQSNNSTYGDVDDSKIYVIDGNSVIANGDTISTSVPSQTSIATPSAGYMLDSWSGVGTPITSDTTVTANFDVMTNQYTVTINTNAYGTVNLNSISVPYGTILEVGEGGVLYIGENVVTATPLPDTIDTHYYFRQWVLPTGMSSGDEITQNIVVSARFGDQVREYEITFNSYPNGYGSVVIESGTGYVAYGSTITVDGDHLEISGGPRRLSVKAVPSEMEVDWTYSFNNWTISSYTVTGDMTIVANFTRTANTVANVTLSTPYGHIHFNGDDYTTLTVRVPIPSMVHGMGTTLDLGEYEITIDEEFQTELFIYTFDRWAGIPLDNQVYNGLTLNAVFTQEDRYYEVNFSIADGFGTLTTDRVLVLYNTLIYSENNVVVVGANTITATPTENGEDVTYEFVRWDGIPMSGRILEDTDISAKIQRTVTANAFNIVEIEHGDVERVWSIPDEYLPLMLVIPVMLLIGMVLLALNRKSDEDDYESY